LTQSSLAFMLLLGLSCDRVLEGRAATQTVFGGLMIGYIFLFGIPRIVSGWEWTKQ